MGKIEETRAAHEKRMREAKTRRGARTDQAEDLAKREKIAEKGVPPLTADQTDRIKRARL